MSSLPYLNISAPFIKSASSITIFANILLIYLTSTSIKTITPAYRCLIIIEAILGIIFSLIELLVQPFLHSYNASFTFFSTTAATSSSMIFRVALLMSYSVVYMIIFLCLSIQFIYRYLVVASPKSLKWFEGLRVIVWIAYGFVCSLVWGTGVYEVLPDEFSKKYVGREMESNYGIDVERLASVQFVAYNENGHLRIRNILGLLSITTILIKVYLIVLYFGWNTHLVLRNLISMSSVKTHRLHSQLFKTLVLQTAVPTVVYNSPVFLMYMVPYFDLKFSFPSGLMICGLNFYPAIDSFILMWMVGEYRRVIRNKVTGVGEKFLKWIAVKNADIESAAIDTLGMEMRHVQA